MFDFETKTFRGVKPTCEDALKLVRSMLKGEADFPYPRVIRVEKEGKFAERYEGSDL